MQLAVQSIEGRQLDRVLALEHEMLKLPQLDIAVRHYFAPGMYAREMTVPAGGVVVGKLHKYALMHTLSKGCVTVLTGGSVQRLEAPHTLVSPPGEKRAFVAENEVVWTVYHPTTLTDLAAIEAHFIARNEAEYLNFRSSEVLE